MMRRFVAVVVLAAALPALAQQAVPAANYTDLWWNPAESGWGLTVTQHPNNKIFAIWYTYDPREPDSATPGNFKPLWIVMSDGTWTSPTSLTGAAYVLNGTPFFKAGSNRQQTQVGAFTFNFSSAQAGTFTYNIQPPAGLAPGDPAYGLPTMSGAKPIERVPF
jgi:lysyl endopeptidase